MSAEYKKIPMEEMARAMLDGHTLEFDGNIEAHFDILYVPPFRVKAIGSRLPSTPLTVLWDVPCRILPKPEPPKTRYMTRDEVIGFVANTPGIAVRLEGQSTWVLSGRCDFSADIPTYEYTTVTLDGVYGEPMEFRKEVAHE